MEVIRLRARSLSPSDTCRRMAAHVAICVVPYGVNRMHQAFGPKGSGEEGFPWGRRL